jgi:hypothetical protein
MVDGSIHFIVSPPLGFSGTRGVESQAINGDRSRRVGTRSEIPFYDAGGATYTTLTKGVTNDAQR